MMSDLTQGARNRLADLRLHRFGEDEWEDEGAWEAALDEIAFLIEVLERDGGNDE